MNTGRVGSEGVEPQTGTSVPKLAGKIKDTLTLLRKDTDLSAKHGATKDFLRTVDDLLAALSGADASQEIKRATVPHTTEEFLIHKARLTLLLKQINRAGEALWIDDPTRRSDYDLSILYRRGVSRKGKDGTPETDKETGSGGGGDEGVGKMEGEVMIPGPARARRPGCDLAEVFLANLFPSHSDKVFTS
ncbi:MAG: hypothetical protein K8T91_18430 [Planctomycetes bacterium]|nr:hypothetical protein [Planctomycetota bacterium]